MTLYGASHAAQIGVVIDGVPAGVSIHEEDFHTPLEARKGVGVGVTPRRESDRVRLVGGVFAGCSTGGPVVLQVENVDTRSEDYSQLRDWPRPGHADYVAKCKYGGYADPRGGGFFSGRMTVGLVLAGVVAGKLLPKGVEISARVLEIGGVDGAWEPLLAECRAEGDSLGGVVECVVKGSPVGLGDPFFDSVESLLSHLIFSIPGVTALEFGSGVSAARMRGSEYNNAYLDGLGHMQGNNSGGMVGGLTHGGDIVFRVHFRPPASIAREQRSFNFATQRLETHSIPGRHDVCFALRTPVIVESAAAFVLADCRLRDQRVNFHKL